MPIKQGGLVLVAVALLPITFYLDISTPPRSVQGIMGYFAAVFMALWIPWRSVVPILLAGSLALLAGGYFVLAAEYNTTVQFATNRIFVGGFLILLGFAVNRVHQYQTRLAAANTSLAQTVDEQTREIAMQRERFHELALAASDCFWRVDREGKNFEVSENSIEALGVGEFQSGSPLEILMASMDAQNQQQVMTAITAREPFSALTGLDTPEKRIWIEVFGRPVFSPPHTFEGYQGVLRNVTNRVELESDLRHAEAMRSVGQLASGLAHDFNNLLFVIGMNLELAAEAADAKAAPLIQQALEANRRGTQLTGLLMASGRSSTQQAQRHDINVIVQEACTSLAPSVASKHELLCDLAEALPQPAVEPVALASALTNLCLNARDAMPEGGVIHVSTTLADSGKGVIVAVKDSGSGISEEEQKKIFDPFYTSKPQGRGTGLGLAMVAKFMEQIDGRIELQSSIGSGTTISLHLPA